MGDEGASVPAVIEAFSTDDAKSVAIVAIVVLVVLGAVASFIVTKLMGRLIVAALVVALGIFIWTQRADIEDAAKHCKVPTFVGIHLTPSKSITDHCRQVTGG